jgi:hypothetical protein
MTTPDPTVTISCDEELVVFSDDANSPPLPTETVTIPPTAAADGSASDRSAQSPSTHSGQENRKK